MKADAHSKTERLTGMPDNIRIIASDFDGTILKDGAQHVDEEYFPLIRELKSMGISFIAASGRQYANLRRLLEPVAEDISYICENGALIAQGGTILYQNDIERNLALSLIRDMQEVPDSEVVVSGADASYMVPVDPLFPVMLREKVKNQVAVLKDFEEMKLPMIKISIYFPKGIPGDKEKWFHEKYDRFLNVVDGGNGWLDFTNKGVDKGSALRLLAAKEQFFLDEVLAFGDSENDMAMLKEAGLSYAMNTAKEHVKKCADRECSMVSRVLEDLIAGRL
ncbi:HAD family phosphatase [Lachnospiraceae bacterium TF09-5]|nr:HAD family phosphatase [Lachnospiraceae bacterium TF09-5]